MSASRAYISSLGTTAILVVASLSVLVLTSAIVAFDRWPGHASVAPVDRVAVGEPTAPKAVVPAGLQSSRGAARAAAPGTASGGTTPIAGREGDRGSAPGGGRRARTLTTTLGSTPTAPAGRAAHTDGRPPSGPGTPRAGDPLRSTGDGAGSAVGSADPAAGQAVVRATDTAASVIDAVAGSPPAGAGG